MPEIDSAALVPMSQATMLDITPPEQHGKSMAIFAFAAILGPLVGPVLVSPDLVNNALPLYFSRPFSRAEYVLGKVSVLALLLSLVGGVMGLAESKKANGASLDQLRNGGMQILPPPAQLTADMKKVGEIMLKEWLDKAGPEGKALIDAFNRK